MTRLTSDIWVSAYLTRLRLEDIPVYVLSKGDPTAGAILVKVNHLDGTARVLHRSWDLQSGDRIWAELSTGDEPIVDASIAKQQAFDPDIWVIEIEARDGRHLLDDPSLA